MLVVVEFYAKVDEDHWTGLTLTYAATYVVTETLQWFHRRS